MSEYFYISPFCVGNGFQVFFCMHFVRYPSMTVDGYSKSRLRRNRSRIVPTRDLIYIYIYIYVCVCVCVCVCTETERKRESNN